MNKLWQTNNRKVQLYENLSLSTKFENWKAKLSSELKLLETKNGSIKSPTTNQCDLEV